MPSGAWGTARGRAAGLQVADAVDVGLAPARDGHALEQAGLGEGIGVDELLRGFARVQVDQVQAAAGIGAVVLQLAPQASSRPLLASRYSRCAARCCWRTAWWPGLSKVSMM